MNKEIVTNNIDVENEIVTLTNMFRDTLNGEVTEWLTEDQHDNLDDTFEEFSMNFTERQYNDWISAGHTREEFEELEGFILDFALARMRG